MSRAPAELAARTQLLLDLALQTSPARVPPAALITLAYHAHQDGGSYCTTSPRAACCGSASCRRCRSMCTRTPITPSVFLWDDKYSMVGVVNAL